MRTIKFRGKRVDNGKWIEGFPIQKEKISGVIPLEEISFTCNGGALDFEYLEVISETVGQFTGLTDKNGKEIFEGDIVKNGLSGTWIIQPLENGSMSLLGICKKYKNSNYDISALNKNVEIIGNIHDNPELLQS